MAQTKLYAPKGMHFMVNRRGGFYLMKNPKSGYKFHKSSNGEHSALYISVEVKNYHATGSATKPKGAIYKEKLLSPLSVHTPSKNNVSTTNTNTSTSSRNRSRGSGGGGY